ncbi:MAG: hypothetical protein IPM34_05790 [Saprospiraceae bacterium]|nr:hypothetical protein [Saprospiraceae bacterium]
MKIHLLLLFVTLSLSSNGQKRIDVRFPMEGHFREAIISIPSQVAPTGGYPLVFMLHGTAQNGQEFYENSGWKELGESENFITVFPTALEWCYTDDGMEENNRRWVCAGVTDHPCSGVPQDYVNDINFLKKLIQIISDSISVNSSMIFASGFSNGSQMIHKLAIDAGDVFAACAGSGAFLARGDSTTPLKRIPVWMMEGTLDEKIIKDPFTSIPYGEDSSIIYLKNHINRMLGCQGLTQDFKKTETAITKTYDFSQDQPGENSQLYRFTIAKGMYHVYPNGNNYPFEAAKIFWEFFKNSVLVDANPIAPSKTSFSFDVFPNPLKGPLHIRLNKSASHLNWTLKDAFGKTLTFGEAHQTKELIIEHTESLQGICILVILTEYGRFAQKIQMLPK